MSEMRFNPVTRDWVIMAPDRALKPDDFIRPSPARPPRPARRDNCPFCVGNEAMTEREIQRIEGADGGWRVRVVPNKYPALVSGDDLRREGHATFHSMAAVGAHEVVIDHPGHDITSASMGPEHLALVLRMYRERYRALRQNPSVESIVIFKNHGERAGTSLEHPHSQIVAAPVVSSQVRLRLLEASRFHDENGVCLYCRVLQDELDAGERILESSVHFAAFVPYASLSPHHIWVFPRRHSASYDSIRDEETDDLALVLGRVLRRLSITLGDPDFNFTIRSAPVDEADSHCYHWYLSIVPRVSRIAGFELGSGMYINSLRPERCAEILRQAPIDL
jgi:UDPglucose--hexose-1-phosphate uridylyltransferase